MTGGGGDRPGGRRAGVDRRPGAGGDNWPSDLDMGGSSRAGRHRRSPRPTTARGRREGAPEFVVEVPRPELEAGMLWPRPGATWRWAGSRSSRVSNSLSRPDAMSLHSRSGLYGAKKADNGMGSEVTAAFLLAARSSVPALRLSPSVLLDQGAARPHAEGMQRRRRRLRPAFDAKCATVLRGPHGAGWDDDLRAVVLGLVTFATRDERTLRRTSATPPKVCADQHRVLRRRAPQSGLSRLGPMR